MYERWITNNAAKVSELSDKKLGYIHIPNMQETGLERFVRALYSDNFDKDGIVLDVRTTRRLHPRSSPQLPHRQGAHHLQRIATARPAGAALFRSQGGPSRSSCSINNRSFSDAEIFPARLPHLGPWASSWPTDRRFPSSAPARSALIDGSKFRTPRIGVHTIKGSNMEKEGVTPDITIEPQPRSAGAGHRRATGKSGGVLTRKWRLAQDAATDDWRRRRGESGHVAGRDWVNPWMPPCARNRRANLFCASRSRGSWKLASRFPRSGRALKKCVAALVAFFGAIFLQRWLGR